MSSIPDPTTNGSTVDRVRRGDVELVVEQQGAGDPPLVLVHGFTGSRLDWAGVGARLSATRRVVTFDHRGHGESTNTGRPESYTFAELGADLAAVVDDVAATPVDLLGHSMGGIVAMRYALDHADRVRSLVLMDTAAAPAGAQLEQWLGPLAQLGRDQGMAAVADVISGFVAATPPGDRATGAPSPDELAERVRWKVGHMDVEALAAFGRELGTYPSMLDELARLRVPVTIVVGENDHGLREGGDAMAARIPGATLVVIDGAGHSPQEDDPDTWVAAIESHLRRTT